MIVGVTGYAKHGKGEVGRRLVEAHGYTEFQFSAALKEMALRLDPYVSSDIRLSTAVEQLGWDSAKKSPEVRRILQVLGTECVRDIIGEDSWIRALAPQVEQVGHAVITDLRFPNEADWVHRNGGVVVRVTRYLPPSEDGLAPYRMFDNGIGTDHPSERHIAELDADYDIRNDGGLRDLDAEVDVVAVDVAGAWDPRIRPGGPYSPYEDIQRPGEHVARTLADCE